MRSNPHNRQDETMHSGADVEAFNAVVNWDIEGVEPPISQPPYSSDVGGALSQGNNYTPSQLFQQWKSSILKEEAKGQIQEQKSSADVEAFNAVVNWDIEGVEPPISQPPYSSDVGGALSQGNNYTPSQLFQQWKSSILKEEAKGQIQEQKSSAVEVNRHRSVSESQHSVNDTSRDTSQPSRPHDDLSQQQADQHNIHASQAMNMQNIDKNLTPNIAQNPKKQLQRMQRMANHQAITTEQTVNATNLTYTRQMPFDLVLPIIKPQLDKDRAIRLQGLYDRLMANKIKKFEFIRQMGNLVGPHMVKVAVYKAQQKQAVENFSLASGSNGRTYPKKPSVGQKKSLEAPVNLSSKKQKVSGAFSDQSIQQLNDVTAVSGLNLREEEEQLFSMFQEETRVSEVFRKIVQDEERLFLQKIPLQKKLAEIMAKCGVKHTSNDLERCLSLCVQERLRGFISNLVRHSKQRVDFEKRIHQTVVTSDVRQQIMSMNQKAREEWEKKQADAEQLQRTDEPEGSGDGDDGSEKSFKVNKEGDDKMRTSAANVAARAAVGGDDIFSKWQLMAELARQKRDGGADSASTSQPSIDIGPKPMSTSERKHKDNPDTERNSGAVSAIPGPVKKSSKNQDLGQSGSLTRSISVKDVLSVLGRENHLSRSTLTYRLYEKVHLDF